MISIRHHAKKLVVAIFLFVTCGSLLVACGGSSDTTAGIGGTGIVSGKITGFGSIYVNGRKFETDSSLFNVDGDTSADQSDLAVGMVVRLKVDVEDGVFGSTALEVDYDDEIEGPVTAVGPQVGTTKSITVFGKTIVIDQTSTEFDDATFSDIAVGNVVEVSGFRVSPTQINATYVERSVIVVEYTKTEVELRGTITDYNAGVPPGILPSFKIDGVDIVTDVDTEIEVPGRMLVDGLYVEVEGVIQSATSILAEEVELEDEDFDDDVDGISLEGIVSDFSSKANDFSLGSQRVNVSTAQFSPAGLTLANGLEIKVEGQIINSVLIADQVEKD